MRRRTLTARPSDCHRPVLVRFSGDLGAGKAVNRHRCPPSGRHFPVHPHAVERIHRKCSFPGGSWHRYLRKVYEFLAQLAIELISSPGPRTVTLLVTVRGPGDGMDRTEGQTSICGDSPVHVRRHHPETERIPLLCRAVSTERRPFALEFEQIRFRIAYLEFGCRSKILEKARFVATY